MRTNYTIILFILLSNLTYSQLLPDTKAKFDKLGAYSIGEKQLFGELIRKTSANSEVDIFTGDSRTYITWSSSIFNFDSSAHQVTTVDKKEAENKTSYYVETFQLGPKERVDGKYILEYKDSKLVKFIVITSEYVMELYSSE